MRISDWSSDVCSSDLIVDRIKDGDVQLIFNTTEGWQSLQDSQSIRASALAGDIAYYTTAAGSDAATHAIGALRARRLAVKPPQDYYCGTSPSPHIDGNSGSAARRSPAEAEFFPKDEIGRAP